MLSEFQEIGYVVVPNLIPQDTCEMLMDYFFSELPEDIKFGDLASYRPLTLEECERHRFVYHSDGRYIRNKSIKNEDWIYDRIIEKVEVKEIVSCLTENTPLIERDTDSPRGIYTSLPGEPGIKWHTDLERAICSAVTILYSPSRYSGGFEIKDNSGKVFTLHGNPGDTLFWNCQKQLHRRSANRTQNISIRMFYDYYETDKIGQKYDKG